MQDVETDPNLMTSLMTLASAEAPYADPFLMEFDSQNSLKDAYSDAPMTFEQALLAARLEAKQAAQVQRGLLPCYAAWFELWIFAITCALIS